MKKIIIVLFIFVTGFILSALYTKNERIKYGEDIEFIQSSFPDIPEIESCHYKVKKIGSFFSDFIGPSNYHITAVIIIDSDEMDMIANQYVGEKRHKYNEDEQITIEIEHRLIDNTSIDDEMIWTYNQEFKTNTLGWRYVGEVYYLEEENAIYIDAENL